MRNHSLALAVSLAASTFAAPAAAAEPRTLFGREVHDPPPLTEDELAARRAVFEQRLADEDLVHSGDLVIPRAQAEGKRPPGHTSFAWDKPPHRQTIFLNFFGGTMTSGTNASEMQSACIKFQTVEYPAYIGTNQAALAIIQIFENAVEPFGVRIAYKAAPPKHLPYSMVMMGGKPGVIGLPQGVLGVSCSLDCGETWWRDATFAFTEESNNVQTLGTTALQEAAHAWGLDHIDGQQNIMYPYATLGDKVWADTCTPYNNATGPIGCDYVHDEFCGENAGKQNDVAELTAYFGPNSVDTVPPTVTLLKPLDGATFQPGDEVLVEATVTDDFEGYGWHFTIPEADIDIPAYNGETSWTIKPPKGVYTVRVEGVDHDRNIGFAEATIYVGVEPPPDTTGDMSTGEPTTSESAGSGGSGGESETLGATGGEPPEKGCACAAEGPSSLSAALLGLLGLGLGRRRRR